MSFEKKNVLVIGATGVVGSGVVRKFLDAGATVYGVSRSEEKLNQLRDTVKISAKDPFHGIVGDFGADKDAAAAKAAVEKALQGGTLDHVVSVQGFVQFAKNPTETPVDAVKAALDDGLYNNLRAAQSFLPALKDREGSSFTLVSGGLAHIPPPMIPVWLGTVKNAALNALMLALAAETKDAAVRVNCVCIHFGVAPVGGNKNQFGMDAESDTLRLGPAFLGVAAGKQKGQLLCLHGWGDADKLAAG